MPNGQATYRRLVRDEAALLLVDHQAGLFGLVHDITPDAFVNNVLALADLGKLFQLPTILTTSAETGPNGPLMPELRATFPNAPYIRRPGQINAWDNSDFVNAVRATGRRQLLVAGITTDVCVAFLALSAIEAGYEVFAVVDACGTMNPLTRDSAWARMQAGGVQLVSWFAAACELQRDWRNDAQGLTDLLTVHLPEYRNLVISHEAHALTQGVLEPA